MRRKNKVLGLALGSGGAKGMAHLGVLKAFEKAGISFGAVAGTSIGSIVGALYAKGYSATDSIELIGKLDYKALAISVLLSGSLDGVKKVFDDVLGESTFDELNLPFSAVATDLNTGEEIIINEGSVSSAVLRFLNL